MPELLNSKRTIERATYTPIQPDSSTKIAAGKRLRRPVDKWSYVAALAPTIEEADKISSKLKRSGSVREKDLKQIVALIPANDEQRQAAIINSQIAAAAEIPAESLVCFGEELYLLRKQAHEALSSGLVEIAEAFDAASRQKPPANSAERFKIPKQYKPDSETVLPFQQNAKIFRYKTEPAPVSAAALPTLIKKTGAQPAGTKALSTENALLAQQMVSAPSPVSSTLLSSNLQLNTVLQWAVDNKVQALLARQTLQAMSAAQSGRGLTRREFERISSYMVSATADINNAFKSRLNNEPVGLLHLERLGFIPAGIERGELIHSVPMSPSEEVNISHKEWSNTNEEFEQIVTDYLESFSEEGVTEKSELAQSTDSQNQHNSNFNMGMNASASYGPVSISTNLGYNVADSSTNSMHTARNNSNELTKRASARVKKEHKVSFKVASASGSEDQAIRKLKNPFVDKAVRVDYYQLVRKWRVDLYRYGVRLTYDLTVPEPGSDILDKIIEMNEVQSALEQGFPSPDATLWWAAFDLAPDQINRDNYQHLAAQYGVGLEVPPEESVEIARSFVEIYQDKDTASRADYSQWDVEVPDGFEVSGYWTNLFFWYYTDEAPTCIWTTNLDTWVGCSGKLTGTINTKYVSAYDAELKLWCVVKDETYRAWQMRSWSALYEAARARYELNRTMLKERLSKLQQSLGSHDAFSLRKVEREEVMKGVLRWLFGPSFSFVPAGLPVDLYKANESVVNMSVWGKALAQGEIIKFLHHAIEWENMLYFLYPYFWSHTAHWELKKYLEHPDLTHRTFLRAGSARVVLTIRPGFEKDFVRFLETGKLDGVLAGDHPYMTIAEELEAFAKTNYPGIRSANPVESVRPLLSPLQQKAWDQMQAIITLLEKYRADHDSYPSTDDGLAALAPYGTIAPADPWGYPYQYSAPGVCSDFELMCYGADGVPGGEGENADITSWAEASLIGQWYEYTPTPALDIAFNETLPTA